MRKIGICIGLLFFSALCFAQQHTGSFPRVTGMIPDPGSAGQYRLQVGAFAAPENASAAFGKLRNGGLNPFIDQYRNLTRVALTGVPARDVSECIRRIGLLGFREVYITKEPPGRAAVTQPAIRTLDEKWNITSYGNRFVSFEFTNEGYYIVVEKNNNPAQDDPAVHFGTYQIQNTNTINLANFGIVKIRSRSTDSIDFTVMLNADVLQRETAYRAEKAEPITDSARTDLLCRIWQIQRQDGRTVTGTENELVVLYSKAGTYLTLYPDGQVELAQWSWKDDAETEFWYSWHEWRQYGSADILRLTRTTLEFADPGYDAAVAGYSAGASSSVYALIPVR
ncbi:hypothetical protein FACS189483_01120 [Spirochaetia bacterium]|nr:hypothetical protein FACS189483_01120 [Spirochaetia bacterium]